jgi:hypothetical protein
MYVSHNEACKVENPAHLCLRRVKGGKSSSCDSRLGGVWCLVGGVEPSDMPEELAVDGRTSGWSIWMESTLFGGALFRGSTPTGQVHWVAYELLHKTFRQ